MSKTIKLTIGVTSPELVDFHVYKNWYVQDGGRCVNKTYDDITEGMHCDDIDDVDCFSTKEDIDSLEQLIEEVDER